MKEKIVLIDGHSILNRAFYGLPDLTNSKGFHTNAIYGFLNIMFRILEEEKPEYLTVAFDVSAPTFRHEMYKEYKGTRKPMPQELREQVPMMKDVLNAMGIKVVEKAGLEADDILGTIAKKSEADGLLVALISGDRDLLQVATDNIMVRIPKTNKGKTVIENYNTQDVIDKYMVPPLGIIELKALMGDSSDNIPGVKKVGEKTATSLLVEYNSIENLYEHIEEITKKGLHDTLVEDKEMAFLSKKLATININADFDYNREEARIGNFYTKEAYALFRELDFKNLLKNFEETDKSAVTNASYTLIDAPEKLENISFCDKIIGLHVLESDGRCIAAIASEDETYVINVEETKSFLNKAINEAQKVSVFDVKKLYGVLSCDNLNKLFCTNIAAYLLNPLKSDYEIQDVARDYAALQYKGYEELWPKTDMSKVFDNHFEMLSQYMADCAKGNYLSLPVMNEKLIEFGMDKLFFDIEMPLSKVLFDMEQVGILVKKQELEAYGVMLKEAIDKIEIKIYDAAGETFNINSPKQLGVILFEKMGLPSGKKTKTGYSTSVEVLEKLSTEYPFVSDILEYRALTKLKSTYADGLSGYIREDGRIHTNFNQTITATGRISSTEPNLQNIPTRTELGRQIRKVFVPKEGFVFTDADYSQIELRLMAHMSGDEELIEAYKQDADIHRITASKVFHVPFEEVTPQLRRNAKAVNFGIVYGISSFGLSQDLSISKKEAAEYINQYFSTYPGVKSFLDTTVAKAKEEGYTATLFGRRRPIPELNSSNFMQRSFGERVAMNAPLQGTAADIMKIAMISIHRAFIDNNMKSRMLLQVHDEVLIETALEEKEKVYEIVTDAMMNAANLLVPLAIDIHSGDNWYEAK